MSKYQPLADLLSRHGTQEVRLPFREIEKSLGFDLPASARTYPAWWSNHEGTHSQARAWLSVGWQTQEVDLKAERVLFRRDTARGHENRHGATGETVSIEIDSLSGAAKKLFRDYLVQAGGDASAAVARAMHEAAMARRGRIIDDIAMRAVTMSPDAPSIVDMIREDRDAR